MGGVSERSSTEKVTLEIATVLAWHDALNAGDGEGLVDVSSDDVELGGPDGSTQGLAGLRAWAADSALPLQVGRVFVDDGVVVVSEQAVRGGERAVPTATAFRVVDGRVVSVFRHDDLDAALAATGLGADDEVDVSSHPDAR